jgi:hypothetical protein
MSLDLQTFANGDANYIPKHNQNYAAIASAVAGLDAQIQAAAGAAVSEGSAFSALFGIQPAIVGALSYLPTVAGTDLSVASGYFWRPSTSTLSRKVGTTVLAFAGVAAGTYYLQVDASGAVTRSVSSSEAVYSVVWSGSAFGTITRLAVIVFGAADWLAAQTSTAMSATYTSLDARFEAVESAIAGGASDVMIFKGIIDCSANPNYPAADAGNLYKISVAGKIGGASGPNVEVGDTIYCITDATIAGTQAAQGSHWVITQVNTDGAVIGPASATNNNLAVFDGTTGKIIKDSGVAAPTGTNTGDQTSVSGNAGTATALATARTIGGVAFDGTANITQPYDVPAFYPGIPTASAKVVRIPIARAVGFAANFAGAYFTASANATATTVFDVQKNGSSIGSVSIASGGISATFTTTSGTAKTFAAGDVLSIIAPASPDATLADPGFVLAGTR